jgi:hypothetical protein
MGPLIQKTNEIAIGTVRITVILKVCKADKALSSMPNRGYRVGDQPLRLANIVIRQSVQKQVHFRKILRLFYQHHP